MLRKIKDELTKGKSRREKNLLRKIKGELIRGWSQGEMRFCQERSKMN